MITLKRGARKRQDKVFFEIKDFRGGTNYLLEEARLAPNESKVNLNQIQVQDGLLKNRWGRDYYGQPLPANCDGSHEYVTADTSTEMVAVAGGKAYKAINGGAWTEISGATFTPGEQCFFMQISGFLYIANGVDSLTRYNGTELETYDELAAPTGLSACVVSGLTSGSITLWGIVTALNEVGETIGSTSATLTVNKERDQWIQNTDKVKWQWSSVSGATRYQLYLGFEEGTEALLVSTTATFYEDDGRQPINPFVVVPLDNTTGAPKFKSMVVSGNRIWATNIPNEKYKVYFSGTGNDMGKFSAFYGGGWINLERGGREMPTVIKHYQSGQGDGRATVLCRTPEGRGAVWQITISNLTVGDTGFSVPSAVKVVGSSGTSSILGVVSTYTDIMFPNKQGWFGLRPKKQVYGILETVEQSSKIRPYWRNLVGSKMDGICAYFYDAKIFISVPTKSTGNSRTIILDTERNNWMVDWDFGVKQFLEHTDNNGVTRFLYVPVNGDRLVEISENIRGDFGQPIATDYTSGRMSLSKLWREFVRVTRVYIKLGSPRGRINFEVSGTERTKPFKSVASKVISPKYSLTGTGYDPTGTVKTGDTLGSPNMFSDSADIRYVDIRKKVRDVQLRVTSNTTDASYTILGFIIEGRKTSTPPPRTWKV